MSAPVLVLLRRRWVEAGQPKDGWIFPALRGGDKSVQPTWVTATLKKRMIAAGFEPVRFHDLRHIAILRMLNGVDAGGNSMDAVTVAGIVGHSTPNVTLSIYGAGVITGRQREALGHSRPAWILRRYSAARYSAGLSSRGRLPV